MTYAGRDEARADISVVFETTGGTRGYRHQHFLKVWLESHLTRVILAQVVTHWGHSAGVTACETILQAPYAGGVLGRHIS